MPNLLRPCDFAPNPSVLIVIIGSKSNFVVKTLHNQEAKKNNCVFTFTVFLLAYFVIFVTYLWTSFYVFVSVCVCGCVCVCVCLHVHVKREK